jgi:hypothetical protein
MDSSENYYPLSLEILRDARYKIFLDEPWNCKGGPRGRMPGSPALVPGSNLPGGEKCLIGKNQG